MMIIPLLTDLGWVTDDYFTIISDLGRFTNYDVPKCLIFFIFFLRITLFFLHLIDFKNSNAF